ESARSFQVQLPFPAEVLVVLTDWRRWHAPPWLEPATVERDCSDERRIIIKFSCELQLSLCASLGIALINRFFLSLQFFFDTLLLLHFSCDVHPIRHTRLLLARPSHTKGLFPSRSPDTRL